MGSSNFKYTLRMFYLSREGHDIFTDRVKFLHVSWKRKREFPLIQPFASLRTKRNVLAVQNFATISLHFNHIFSSLFTKKLGQKGGILINTLSYVLPVIYTLLQIVSLMVIGGILTRSGVWSKAFFTQLSRFMVRVALPIHFFAKLSQINPADIRTGILFPFVAVGVIALGGASSALLFHVFSADMSTKRVGIALSTFGNSAILPLTLIEIFPLTLPVVGERFGITTPSLYVGAYLLVQTPVLWSVGNFLVSGKGRLPRLRELLTPPLFGIAGGLLVVLLGLQPLVLDQHLPFFHVLKSLERFGQVAFPIILLCLGSMIARIPFREHDNRRELLTQALLVSMTRFLVLPLLFIVIYLLIVRRLPLTPAQYWVIFLQMHIPPASNLSMMAAQAGMNEKQVSCTTFITYLVYMVALPVYMVIFLSLPGIL